MQGLRTCVLWTSAGWGMLVEFGFLDFTEILCKISCVCAFRQGLLFSADSQKEPSSLEKVQNSSALKEQSASRHN